MVTKWVPVLLQRRALGRLGLNSNGGADLRQVSERRVVHAVCLLARRPANWPGELGAADLEKLEQRNI